MTAVAEQQIGGQGVLHDFCGGLLRDDCSPAYAEATFDDLLSINPLAMEDVQSIDPEELLSVREDVGRWLEERYGKGDKDTFTWLKEILDFSYDIEGVADRIAGLAGFLRSKYPNLFTANIEQQAKLFVAIGYNIYNRKRNVVTDAQPEDTPKKKGFAFLVHSRTSYFTGDAYREEAQEALKITDFVPGEYVSMFGIGMPEFPVTKYNNHPTDDTGCGIVRQPGTLFNVGVFLDSLAMLSKEEAEENARLRTENAAVIAREVFNAAVVGLGGVLPRATDNGRDINVPGIFTTTGHAGTIYSMDGMVDKAIKKGVIDKDALKSLVFLGPGKIGLPSIIYHALNDRFAKSKITIYDNVPKKMERATKVLTDMGREHKLATDIVDALNSGRVIYSTLTSPVDLDAIDPDCKIDLTGKLIVDDSQPGMFSKEQVERRGGTLTWVLAKDTKNLVKRDNFTIGGSASGNTLFGCEAEAAALAYYYNDLIERRGQTIADKIIGKVAVRDMVTARDVKNIGALFERFGIVAAELQVNGEYV